MSKGSAHFTSQELALVLSHYDIGIIQQITPLYAGNKRSAKQIIVSDRGKYLLKRKARDKDDRYRVAFAHNVQQYLKQKNFPVAAIIPTRDGNNTFLEYDHHIYELFEFINGIRFQGKIESVVNAGIVLAKFHTLLEGFSYTPTPIPTKESFHNSRTVRTNLKKICSKGSNILQDTADRLMSMYNNASVNINQLDFDNWQHQIVHGDWHPGNMLFMGGKVAAVVDFDSLKISTPMTDVANGALQFSIVGGRPNPADWPDYLDQSKLTHFIHGYCEIKKLKENELKTLPDLMIEALIAEAVIPIAHTGSFVNLSGDEFLKMIYRKCLWIDRNRQTLDEAVEHSLQDLLDG